MTKRNRSVAEGGAFRFQIAFQDYVTSRADNLKKTGIWFWFNSGGGHSFLRGAIILLLGMVTTQLLFGATYTVVVYDTDGLGTQTKRPTGLSVFFKQGEIAPGSCARPVLSGTPVTDGLWQEDRKTSYPDGSAEHGIVTVQATISSGGSNAYTFQNGTCANTPLSAAAMANFDAGQGAGTWDGQFSFTPKGGSAYTQNIKAMLTDNDPNSNTFGDCKNNFWQKGPVVTTVIVQDCSSASKWDFGWHWTGGVMIGADGNPHTSPYLTNSQFASIHPYAIVHFYPSVNGSTATIFIEGIIENDWTGRAQDQNFDNYAFKTFGSGASLSTVYTRSSNFTMIWGSTNRKIGWSGPALGNVRVDLDFAHLRETHAIPYYDLTSQVIGKVSTSSSSPADSGASGCATDYTDWAAAGKGDFGDTTGGIVAIDQDYASNCEGAPVQREPLLYLYNMNAAYSADGGNAGTANGEAAKAWLMLFGLKGAADGSITSAVNGGAGVAGNGGNIPFHARESRTAATGSQSNLTNYAFCGDAANPATKGFDDKNAAGNSTDCTGGVSQPSINVATGRFVSRHAHSESVYGPALPPFPATAVGTISSGGWSISGCNHWQDWAYEPYLLTGSYYFLQEVYASASFCASAIQPDNAAFYGSHGFFAYSSPQGPIFRELGWAIQMEARAAYIAPDNSTEKALYSSNVRSNLEVQEGVQSLTGTDLTPTTTHPNCDSGTISTWNRWDFGRCAAMSTCSSTTNQNFTTVAACVPNVPHRHESGPSGYPAGSFNSANDNSNMIFVNAINVQTACGNITGIAHVTTGAISSIDIAPGGDGGGTCGGSTTCTIKSNTGSGATCTVALSGGSATSFTVTNGGSGYVAPKSRSYQQSWMENFLVIALAQTRLLGFTEASYVQEDSQKQPIEYVLDSTSNGYLIGNFLEAGASLTNSATAPAPTGSSMAADSLFSDWATWLAGNNPCLASVNTFDPHYATTGSCAAWTPQVCSNHAYPIVARAALSTAPYFGTSSSNPNCSGGTCTAAAAWAWISSNSRTPYFNNTASQNLNTPCGNNDYLVKFALDSEPSGVTVTSCDSLSPSSATISIFGTQNFTASVTYSDSSTASGVTSGLSLSSGTPSVATVSSQTATGVSGGSSTISGTVDGHACGNTSALTVSAAAAGSIRTPGTISTANTSQK